MTISVKHKFTSSKADSADASIVRPSNWNDDHAITIAGFSLVGKATAGDGVATEVQLGTGLSYASGYLTANAGSYDSATLTANFAAKVSKAGDTMTGQLAMVYTAPALLFVYPNVKGTQIVLDGAGNLLFRDFQSNQNHMYLNPNGVFFTQEMGQVSSYIESRAKANVDAYAVQQSQAAGYVEVAVKTGSSGGGDFNYGGYFVTRIYKNGVEQINIGGRQPQLYCPNRGWFVAFPF